MSNCPHHALVFHEGCPGCVAEFSHPDDPKDDGGRVPGFTYAWMIPYLTRTARRCGYALAVHGSMGRDLDLIAVPWVETAWEPDALAKEMARMVDGTLVMDTKDTTKAGTPKLHGRVAYSIIFKGAWHTIDLSVMPKTGHTEPAVMERVSNLVREALQHDDSHHKQWYLSEILKK